MELSNSEIEQLERVKKLNMINSITGIKPANLIGTRSNDGLANLAIFSSVVHLGSNPPLIGYVMRPVDEVPKDTYTNIIETRYYTINHVTTAIIEKAHYTSAKVARDVSEFERCGLTEAYIDDFPAPFVRESKIKMGLSFVDQIPIPQNGTSLIIGKIEKLIVPDELISREGYINLEQANTAGISGLNSYYELKHLDNFPYARPEAIPDFSK